jgi:4-amino-4-deoxy-L-arabinose transferase-like glycosyltransferase
MTVTAQPTSTDPDTKARSRWEPIAVVAGVVVVIVVTATTRARTLTEEDSRNLARALHHYSVALLQPHAPGYPLVVLAAHAFTWVGSALNAYIVVAVLATVGTILLTYLLGVEMFGRRAGVVAALVVCATPLALYYGEIVSVYPTESLMVPTVALLAHRVARRADRFSSLFLFPVLAIGGGFRPTMLVLMLPACVVGIVFGRPRARDLVAGLLAAIAVVAAWGIPMVVKSGGWQAYSRASQALYHRQFSLTSIFYGASYHQVAFNAANTLGATAMVALPAAAVVVLAFGPQKSAWGLRHPAMWIMAASLIPYWVTFFAIQLGKPGYVLATLPIFAVLAGGLVAASDRAVFLAVAVTVITVTGYLVLPQWPLPWRLDAFFPTAHAVHVQDQEALGLERLGASCPRNSCTIVSLPTSRRFWYHDPASLYQYAPNSRVLLSDDVSADRASLGEVLWVGTTIPRAVSALATPEGSYGTWAVYQSRGAVTEEIVRQAFG